MDTAGPSGLVHEAFVYSSDDEFLDGALPFLEEGVERGEPVLAAPTKANARLLRQRLGERAAAIDWAHDSESHAAVQRLAIFIDYIDGHVKGGAERVRLLGEPCWPADGGPGVAEWKRYESFLNLALAPHPVWLVCPYDARALAPDIVEDARRTHPTIGYGDNRRASTEYVEPPAFSRGLDRIPLSKPPLGAAEAYVDNPSSARRFVGAQARRAGLEPDRANDVEAAASELAANVFRHAARVARIRAWKEHATFIFDVDDTGTGFADPFAGYAVPEQTAPSGRGLMIARRLADVLQIRTTPTGGVVRAHFSL